MPVLYSYCIPHDTGAAPNPFWGVCTLVICKPLIRRNAQKDDWIVGTGSKHFGFENKVVFAMEVTRNKLTMKDYDEYCKNNLPQKIPNWRGKNYKERVGDCIYDFSVEPVRIRKSVHNEGNQLTDLSGKYALLSDHFYYFGDKPIEIHPDLLPIIRQGQGYRSTSNNPYYNQFVEWILTKTFAKNKIYSEPKNRHKFMLDEDYISKCAARDREQDEKDGEITDK